MSRVHTRGLVLRRMIYSDTSQIAWLFTKDLGIVHVLAKGALRPARRSSSFPAPFDSAGWYDLVIRTGRGDVHQAFEARLIEGFDHLHRHLPHFVDTHLALEVMLKMFSPLDPHPEFLRGALSYLKLLGVGQGREALRVHFYSQMLRETGFAPAWQACVECGAVINEDLVGVRIPHGAVCGHCCRGGDERVPRSTLEYLLQDERLSWSRVPGLDPGPEALESAWRLLRGALLYHLDRPPRALRYLRDGPAGVRR